MLAEFYFLPFNYSLLYRAACVPATPSGHAMRTRSRECVHPPDPPFRFLECFVVVFCMCWRGRGCIGGGEAVRAPGKPGERTGPQLVLFKRFKSLHDTSLDRTCALNLRGERMRDGVVLLSSSQGGCELPKLLLTKCL